MGETGVLGTLKGAKDNGKVLVLRADIDALPIEETHECVYRSENAGVMHACGHDAHAACLLGAAKILSENRDAFSGKVRLVFQPGEEIGKGAKPFVAAGVLDGAERVFGLHTAYDLEAGTVGLKPGINNAAVDHFRIRVHGKVHACFHAASGRGCAVYRQPDCRGSAGNGYAPHSSPTEAGDYRHR